MLRALDRFMRTQSSPEIRRTCRHLEARYAFDMAAMHYKQRRPLRVLWSLGRSLWWAPNGAGGRECFEDYGFRRIGSKLLGAGERNEKTDGWRGQDVKVAHRVLPTLQKRRSPLAAPA